MRQPDLFSAIETGPAIEAGPELVCANGEPWMGPHPLCDAMTQASHRAFVLDVAAGKYDRYGYTPADRRALERKNKERAAAGLPPRVPSIELVTEAEVLTAQEPRR